MLIVSRIIQVPYLASTRYCPGLSIVIKLAFEPVDQRIDVLRKAGFDPKGLALQSILVPR